MQGARNSPWMDEDPECPHQTFAGGPVGYKHGLTDGKRGQDRKGNVARAAQQTQENGKAQDAGNRPRWVTGCGKGEWDVAGLRARGRGEAEKTKQPPGGIGKPVAVGW